MGVQGFNGSRCAATVIFRKRNKGPAHTGKSVISTVEHILAAQYQLAIPGQGPIYFPVSNTIFSAATEIVPVRDIEGNSFFVAPFIKFTDSFPGLPLGIFQALMPYMRLGGAQLSRVGTVVFQKVETCFFKEGP